MRLANKLSNIKNIGEYMTETLYKEIKGCIHGAVTEAVGRKDSAEQKNP